MPNDNQPVIIENIFRFPARWLFQKEKTRITGVSQGVISKVLRHKTRSLTQGLRGHGMNTTT